MNKVLPRHLQPIVESLCETGCQNVNAVIEILNNGEYLKETAELSAQERALVLNELKIIMSVYDKDD